VADEAVNAKFFGYPGASRGESAFPQARVLGLVECGTHAVVAVNAGQEPFLCDGETALLSLAMFRAMVC
jgi:hypothetical protein